MKGVGSGFLLAPCCMETLLFGFLLGRQPDKHSTLFHLPAEFQLGDSVGGQFTVNPSNVGSFPARGTVI